MIFLLDITYLKLLQKASFLFKLFLVMKKPYRSISVATISKQNNLILFKSQVLLINLYDATPEITYFLNNWL